MGDTVDKDPIFCHRESEDGRICRLYKDHYGPHKTDHMKSSWDD